MARPQHSRHQKGALLIYTGSCPVLTTVVELFEKHWSYIFRDAGILTGYEAELVQRCRMCTECNYCTYIRCE